MEISNSCQRIRCTSKCNRLASRVTLRFFQSIVVAQQFAAFVSVPRPFLPPCHLALLPRGSFTTIIWIFTLISWILVMIFLIVSL